jgi:Rrf2 family transcriptional regulator, nitric oxide-sensitive transcriptional repressor
MRLTRFTDNALRCLTYLALTPDETPTVGEVASRMGMSEDHLLKVVQRLSRLGFVRTIRGRRGGVRLAQAPAGVRLGHVVRQTEDNMVVVPCFNPSDERCPVRSACQLAGIIDEALGAFLAVLDQYTVADLVAAPEQLVPLVGLANGGAAPATR